MTPRPPRNIGRRQYRRGYYHGQRNTPFTMLPDKHPDTIRGWGAGQAWLQRKTS